MNFSALVDLLRGPRTTVHEDDNEPKNMINEQILNRNTERGSKFLAGTLAAWPAYWLVRGMEWSSRRGKEPLQFYINRTFYQAKLLQMFLLTSGFLFALSLNEQSNALPVSEENKSSPDFNMFDTFPH